jgi:hypothetical protein
MLEARTLVSHIFYQNLNFNTISLNAENEERGKEKPERTTSGNVD